jgi:hypothetical protein
MPTEPTDFRDRLLHAQPMTRGLRDEYRKELDALLHHRLTPTTRRATWGGIAACLVFVGLCLRALVLYRGKDPQLWIVMPSFIAVSVALAGWLTQVLRRGGFARRTMWTVIEWLGGAFVSVVVIVNLLGGINKPSDPASTYAAVWALLLIIVAFAWATGNRIAALELRAREQLLRLESRLADLAERLPPAK